MALLTSTVWAAMEVPRVAPRGPVRKDPPSAQVYNLQMENRVHRASGIWMNITNYGFFGNLGREDGDALIDPEYPGVWAPQLEYPGGSNRQYMFMGALWVGAMIRSQGSEFPRVSVGIDGWTNPNGRPRGEFFPGEGSSSGIIERSTKLNAYNRLGAYITDTTNAVSQQDFEATYTDTVKGQSLYNSNDEIDGPHFPLGIEVKQSSYAWTYNYAQNFIIIDYEFKNIATNYLKNLYIGLYMDADVGLVSEGDRHTDDITGFQEFYYPPVRPDGSQDSLVINTAWIADNDGRPHTVASGSEFTVPDVFGARVLRAPNPRLKTSYNWWISFGTAANDFGPSWIDDESEGNWTASYGTPMGDKRKYHVLSNREFDYDQLRVDNRTWIEEHPQRDLDNPAIQHEWRVPDAGNATDLANGYDTRFLLSWGPLGVFDYLDPQGNRVYRLNPGEQFSMTIALVMGQGFHDPNNPQIGNTNINNSRFRFDLLQRAAAQAARVYDNPMKDTKTRRYPNGDGWFGEDVGTDGLFAEQAGDSVVIDGIYHDIYPGPDADGTENNGRIDSLDQTRTEFALRTEDIHPWKPARYDYTSGNGILDPGDCEPDFLGPPPPPAPVCSVFTTATSVKIRWRPMPSEDPAYSDPFSGLQDFEGYRLYVSNTGLESEFSFIKQWDQSDYAYYAGNDSLVTIPVPQDSIDLHPEWYPLVRTGTDGNPVYRRPVGANTGFAEIIDSMRVTARITRGGVTVDTTYWDKYYEYEIKNVAPIFARYYAVTCYDFGDPKGGTESLETSKTATSFRTAPSGEPSKKVGVAPNPYRVDQNYTVSHSGGLQWENQDDGTVDFFPQQDRRIWFYNLPKQALIRIFTVSGDVVTAIPHNIAGDNNLCVNFDYAECWNLQNRNEQMVASGLYFFSVEDKTPGGSSTMQTGKFVVIR
ncbi:MAG: hypothetical protein OEM52_02925 [bacterium]|nr:hypothetical protein [bacterium]